MQGSSFIRVRHVGWSCLFSANCDGKTLKDMLCKSLNDGRSEMQMLAAKWFVAETDLQLWLLTALSSSFQFNKLASSWLTGSHGFPYLYQGIAKKIEKNWSCLNSNVRVVKFLFWFLKTLSCLAGMCKSDKNWDERVEAAETLAYLIEVYFPNYFPVFAKWTAWL